MFFAVFDTNNIVLICFSPSLATCMESTKKHFQGVGRADERVVIQTLETNIKKICAGGGEGGGGSGGGEGEG